MVKSIPLYGNPNGQVFGAIGSLIEMADGIKYIKVTDDSKNIGWASYNITPTPTPSISSTPSTPTPTPTPTSTKTTPTPTITQTPTSTQPTPTPTPTSTQPTPTPTPTPTSTQPTPTPTPTPTSTQPTPTPTPSSTQPTPTPTPTPTTTPTITPSPSPIIPQTPFISYINRPTDSRNLFGIVGPKVFRVSDGSILSFSGVLSAGYYKTEFQKLSNDGASFIFQKNLNTATSPIKGHPLAFHVDENDNMYIAVDGEEFGVFIIKLNSTGSVLWRRNFYSTDPFAYGYNFRIGAIKTDSFGNVYACGSRQVDGNNTCGLLIKLDSSGGYQWQKSIRYTVGTQRIFYFLDMVIDSNDYVHVLSNSFIFGPSGRPYRAGLHRCSPSGNFTENQSLCIYDNSNLNNLFSGVGSLAIDSSNNIYIALNSQNSAGTNDGWWITKVAYNAAYNGGVGRYEVAFTKLLNGTFGGLSITPFQTVVGNSDVTSNNTPQLYIKSDTGMIYAGIVSKNTGFGIEGSGAGFGVAKMATSDLTVQNSVFFGANLYNSGSNFFGDNRFPAYAGGPYGFGGFSIKVAPDNKLIVGFGAAATPSSTYTARDVVACIPSNYAYSGSYGDWFTYHTLATMNITSPVSGFIPSVSNDSEGGILDIASTFGYAFNIGDGITVSNTSNTIGFNTGLSTLSYINASGGRIHFHKNNIIHTFNTPGTNYFTINSLAGVSSPNFDYLLVGGGSDGNNGNSNFGNDGGAGGAGGSGGKYYPLTNYASPSATTYTLNVGYRQGAGSVSTIAFSHDTSAEGTSGGVGGIAGVGGTGGGNGSAGASGALGYTNKITGTDIVYVQGGGGGGGGAWSDGENTSNAGAGGSPNGGAGGSADGTTGNFIYGVGGGGGGGANGAASGFNTPGMKGNGANGAVIIRYKYTT